MTAPLILAHATGFTWDEALLVMAPIAAIAAVVFLVNARVNKLRAAPPDPPDGPEDERSPGVT